MTDRHQRIGHTDTHRIVHRHQGRPLDAVVTLQQHHAHLLRCAAGRMSTLAYEEHAVASGGCGKDCIHLCAVLVSGTTYGFRLIGLPTAFSSESEVMVIFLPLISIPSLFMTMLLPCLSVMVMPSLPSRSSSTMTLPVTLLSVRCCSSASGRVVSPFHR